MSGKQRRRVPSHVDQREKAYKVDLGGGTGAIYILRGLTTTECSEDRKDEAVTEWATFCASVFSSKENPPPADYFYRHYKNDPDRGSPALIRVAVLNGEIVASCRIFLRTLSTGSGFNTTVIRAGGIGEVCTAAPHRKRGLSKELLQSAISIMKNDLGLDVSLLHARPAFQPVYEKLGFRSRDTCWSALRLQNLVSWSQKEEQQQTERLGKARFSVRPARFPDDTDRLAECHSQYSERKLAGCIIRSHSYWNDYLSIELMNTLFVLVVDGVQVQSEDLLIVAWMSIRPIRGSDGPCFQLCEFGVERNNKRRGNVTTLFALCRLLVHALSKEDVILSSGDDSDVTLIIPHFVMDEIQLEKCPQDIKWTDATAESGENLIDSGWMYLNLNHNCDSEGSSSSGFLDDVGAAHFIWPSDGF